MVDTGTNILHQRYQLLEEIGSGGIGSVYKAHDLQSGQFVAVKRLKSEVVAQEPDMVARFKREAEALRDLDHPNIVKLIEYIEENGINYLVMEYVEGGSLQERLKHNRRMPILEVIGIAMDLADALTRAHRMRIIHRDIKPANVLLNPVGIPKLADFGLARLDSPDKITQSGVTLGTPLYLPPEVLKGNSADERADIWAFGVLLYEMLTGTLPFEGDTSTQALLNILFKLPRNLSDFRDDIPAELANLVYGMLMKDPDKRIPSVRQVGATLENIQMGSLSAESETNTYVNLQRESVFTPYHNLPKTYIDKLTDSAFESEHEIELESLRSLLSSQQTQLVTVLDLEAVNRSDLVRYMGFEVVERYPNGVYYFDLAGLKTPDTLIEQMRREFQITPDSQETTQTALIRYLRDKHLLLILDNFPKQGDTLNFLREVLETAPDVHVLTTTSTFLGLPNEIILDRDTIQTKHAQSIMRRGLADYRRLNTPLPFAAYVFVLEQIQAGRFKLEPAMEKLWKASRASAFQQRLIFRLLFVALPSPLIGVLAFGFYTASRILYGDTDDPLLYGLLLGFFSAVVNSIAVSVYTVLDYLEYPKRTRLWIFPLALGLINMLIFSIPLSNYSLFNGMLIGFVGGVIMGVMYEASLPVSLEKSMMQIIRRVVFVVLLIGGFGALGTIFPDNSYADKRGFVILQALGYALSFTMVYVVSITFVERQLLNRR